MLVSDEKKEQIIDILIKNKRLLFVFVIILSSLIGLFIYERGLSNAPQIIDKTPQNSMQLQDIKKITVQLDGAVFNPGVYQVSSNVHLYELLILAGNILPEANLSKLNLAMNLADGDRITVPFTKVPKVRAASIPKYEKSEYLMVNVNNGQKNDLMSLPGIGESYAINIIEYRKKNGQFKSPSDLLNIKGIGPSKLKKIIPFIEF